MPTAPSSPTPQLYPTLQRPSSLAGDMLQKITLSLAGKQSTKVNRPLTCDLFLLNPACCLMVRPYSESLKFTYITTLSYSTDTILPGWGYASEDHSRGVLCTPLSLAGKQSIKVNRPLTRGLFLFYPAHCLTLRPYANSSQLF